MAFKSVIDLDAAVTVSLGSKDKKTTMEGYYLGAKTVADKKKKSGTSKIYIFQTEAGNVGVWGKTNLDQKMLSVIPGTMTRVTQDGMRKTPNGDMYLFTVEVDNDNTIDVGALATAATTATSEAEEVEEEGTEAEEEPEEETEENADEAEAALVAAQAEVAKRRVKTMALLNKNKSK